ncbi:MAG: 2-iminoacetate synthase ThiH [Desulfovibrionaceae bacterium]|nr:2-iminoacetate synthase ThiH [Desulfovibrionaceae bacterium]
MADSFEQYWAGFDRAQRERDVELMTAQDVRGALSAENPSPRDFLALLSPAAAPFLEDMARRARELTTRHFGYAVNIFTPLYISDVCTNHCRYCGFNAKNRQKRTHLSVEEAVREAMAIRDEGFEEILLLTGEAPRLSSPQYIADVVRRIRGHFASIGIEVYSLEERDYRMLVEAGVSSMTMFQETYNPELYAWLHPAGPKSNYSYRLNAPERACRAGMRSVGLGALLGLDRVEHDGFATGLHAWWLQRRYPGVDIAVSIPRICSHEGSFDIPHELDDRRFVQYVSALRIFLPRASITCSSRESADMRNHLVQICVNRVSAGVSTAVGGRVKLVETPPQFDITDSRSMAVMEQELAELGFQAVLKDWEDPTADRAEVSA